MSRALASDFVEGDAVVEAAERAGGRAARGGERRETQRAEDARRAAIPGVGDDERAAGMQRLQALRA